MRAPTSQAKVRLIPKDVNQLLQVVGRCMDECESET